jgi:hypothetical protein
MRAAFPSCSNCFSRDAFRSELLRSRRDALLAYESGLQPKDRKPHILEALQRKSELEADRAEAEAERLLKRCIKECTNAHGDEVIGRLKMMRDKLLAHSAFELTAPGARRPITYWSDINQLLKTTIPLVQRLNILIDGQCPDFDREIRQSSKQASDFWE